MSRTSRSLRSRLAWGSLLWTVGMVASAHFIAMGFLHRYPRLRGIGMATVVVVSLVFVAIGLAQVLRGITPLERLRERLAAVREGSGVRIEGRYPAEVEPLVHDLNALLDDRERAITRALATAGDLAHGLKTPLAVLSQEAEAAEAAGQHDLAATIAQQVERMRRQVDYHLAHARASAAAGTAPAIRCSVAASAEGLARTLLRLHADRGLALDVHVPHDQTIRGRREDLDEMLGNLLDNACKWARSRVVLASIDEEGAVVITVDDDGPGLSPSLREAVLQRGVRADEAAPGSGLGLAIVRDLVALHGGSVALEDSPIGGLRARLSLPR
jgi:signal transduction histidine kinase